MADTDTDTSDDAGRDVGGGIGGSLAGGDSPWAHDGPVPPASPLPAAWTSERSPNPVSDPAVTPFRVDTATGRDVLTQAVDVRGVVDSTAHRRTTRRLVAGGIAGVLVIAAIGAQTLGGDGDTTDTNDDRTPGVTEAEAAPSTTERARPSPVSPSRPTTSPPVESLPEPPPEWVTAPVALDPRLRAMTVPTQLVVMNGTGGVHVIDIPTGAMRSIETGIGRSNLAMVVGGRTIAVTSYDDGAMAVIDPNAGVSDVELDGGAGQILARPGTNDFLVSPNEWSGNGPPPSVLVAADGTAVEISDGPIADYEIWGIRYLPATGEVLVEDSGGAYAIDDAGVVRRLSVGDLIAVGDNHVLVRECDEALVCTHVRVDAITGERQPVVVPDIEEQFRGFDPTIGLSPDGSMMTYLDWASGPLERRLARLDTGAIEEIESNDQFGYGYNAGWAADSSGIFVIDGRRLVFHDTTTGVRIDVAPDLDVGALVAVATRSPSG